MLPPGAMPTSAQARRACSQSMLATLEVTHDPSSAAKQQLRTIRDMLHSLRFALTSAGARQKLTSETGPICHARRERWRSALEPQSSACILLCREQLRFIQLKQRIVENSHACLVERSRPL